MAARSLTVLSWPANNITLSPAEGTWESTRFRLKGGNFQDEKELYAAPSDGDDR
jgi:hypothetical protein